VFQYKQRVSFLCKGNQFDYFFDGEWNSPTRFYSDDISKLLKEQNLNELLNYIYKRCEGDVIKDISIKCVLTDGELQQHTYTLYSDQIDVLNTLNFIPEL
jgi:hypothetical protein